MLRVFAASFAAAAFVCAAVPSHAQSGVYTPTASGPERKAIMDALRVPVQRDLHMPIIFLIRYPQSNLRVKQGWAFVLAQIRHSNGDPMEDAFFDRFHGRGDDIALALLHRIGGQWRVVKHASGIIDPTWMDWGRTYHAPPGLVPRG